MAETARCWSTNLRLVRQTRTLMPQARRAHRGEPAQRIQVPAGKTVRMHLKAPAHPVATDRTASPEMGETAVMEDRAAQVSPAALAVPAVEGV